MEIKSEGGSAGRVGSGARDLGANRTGQARADATRQKWKDEEAPAELHRETEGTPQTQLELKKKNDDMKRGDRQRLKERKARKAKVAQDAADGVGTSCIARWREREKADAIIEATLTE